jgi:RHS repeat-associated protein
MKSGFSSSRTLSVLFRRGSFFIAILLFSLLFQISALAQLPTVAVYLSDSPLGGAYANYSVYEGAKSGYDTTYLVFSYYPTGFGYTVPVQYSISGTASGSDYSPTLTGSVDIPVGTNLVAIPIHALLDNLVDPVETLNIILTARPTYYNLYTGFTNCTVQINDETPQLQTYFFDSSVTEGQSSTLVIQRTNPVYTFSAPTTVTYQIGGTAVSGKNYAAFSGTATIAQGSNYVLVPITTYYNPTNTGTKTLTVTLNSNSTNFIISGQGTATLGILNDMPIINVTASANLAYQGSSSGQFTVTRNGGLETNLNVKLSVSGTAIAGTDYVAIPTNIMLAAGVTTTNLIVAFKTNAVISFAKTVVLGLATNAFYMQGLNTNAIVTLLPASSATNSVTSPVGRYWRGSGSDPSFWSIVVPLDYQTGVTYDNLYGNAYDLYEIGAWNNSINYHYNATNTLSQTNVANRIAFNNPIVAFGERTGGTPLYISQPYSFGIYAGDPVSLQTPIVIQVYSRSNFALAGSIYVTPPDSSNTNSWNKFATNGFLVITSTNYLNTTNGLQLTTNAFGLTTRLASFPSLSWGTVAVGNYLGGDYILTHTASSAATNYYYLVESYGYLQNQSSSMAVDGSGQAATPSLLYTLEFETRPAWRSVFLDQPHFDGQPLPPFYAGKTLSEMLTNTPAVTNIVSFTPTAATNLDNSPELRRHPMLDQFVADMGNDPIALANYVINEVDLTDPMDYSDNGNVAEQSINPPGVSRGALGTFLEKQGSPVEQCALLVYLLRQAGVPAVYEFAPRNGMQILDARLSRMLKFQVHGGFDEAGRAYTTNTMIPVNYPWVAAYIGTNWVHIFPWLKDYEITEGFDLYDNMPTNYPNAYPWVRDYIYGNSNLMSLAVSGDNTPLVIFPAFLKQTLQQNHPGVSVDDLGVKILNRRHYYSRWQDFPTPTAVTNVSTAIENLTSSAITNISPTLTNVFDTLSVEIYSANDPTKDIQTGDMRLCDLHDREFYIYQTVTNSTQVLLNLVLLPYRTNVTTTAAFSNDTNLLSKEVLSLTLDQFDDQLGVRFRSHRHRALSPAYAVDPSLPFLGYSGTEEMDVERPLRKGDQAAICMSYGQVTRAMLLPHANNIWQMEAAVRANKSATNSVSPDVYQGATMYLAGMTYYEKVGEFDRLNQNLHKINTLSSWAIGLSKISPARDSSGSLSNGTDPVLPNVDMFFYEMASVGNGTVRPDSGQTFQMAENNYNLIAIADISAEEHQAINRFYQQTNAVSTVRLLQLAQSSGAGIVPLNINNYVTKGQTSYQGTSLQNWDTNLWSQVTAAFQNASDGSYVTAYITPGPVTNSAYKGMAALVLGWSKWQAIITPGSMNGAFGSFLPPCTFTAVNTPSFYLTDSGDSSTFSMLFGTPASGTTLVQDSVPNFNFSTYNSQILAGSYAIDPFSQNWGSSSLLNYNLSTSGTANQQYSTAFSFTTQYGDLGKPDDGGSTLWSKVSDPVHSVTGEFYVDETDLQLPGPLPLSLRRNYSSQNASDNQFGTGWKLSLMPYLCVAKGGTNIYAADMDGAVLAYVRTNVTTNVWMPTVTANPSLNNDTTAGVGALANRLRDRLVQTVNGSTTNFTLYGADGSTRFFQWLNFTNAGVVTNSRPYLLQWTDSRGNFYTFSYGTNSTQNDFGQVRRIQSSNGNYLGLYYDIYGHIVEAYCGDGRRLYYDYDDYGDLVTVTLPDATTRSYVYQHLTQTVTGGSAYYSTHLLVEEDKPDGRTLQNAYDSQRRVTNQLSTAGIDLTPIRTATFVYSNNFVYTNSWTNKISGYTLIVDGNSRTNRYDYTNSLITKITDPLNQTIQQSWYADNATAPGYPRSLSQVVDKRSMTNQFLYDSNGNITNTVIIGDLTGDGIGSQTATNTAIYNTNSLPVQITDAAGNSTVVVYDPVFSFLPQQTTRYAGATPVSTSYTLYGNATNVVINGSVTQTNMAFGLPTRQIRAYDSADAATNDLAYNGNGFVTQSTRYTGTADPNIVTGFYFNERGQMVNQVDALGAVTFFDYDALNRPTEQENFDENGNALAWNFNYYNDNGELSWTDGPRCNPEDYVFFDYDGAGRRSTEIHWRSQAKSDGTGVQAPSGYNLYAQSFFQYDPLGNLTRAVDPRGAITTNSYDAVARMVQRKHLDTDGVTVLSTEGFGYEPGGQVKFYTNALGGVTTTLYTTTGKPEYRATPEGATNGWRYYLDGRVKREIQGNGAYWQTTYDDVNRITTRIFYSAAGSPLATNSVQVDRRRNVIQRVDAGNNVFTTTFDDLDRVKISAGPAIVTVSSYTAGTFPTIGGPLTYVTNVLQQVSTNLYGIAGRAVTNANALGEKAVTMLDAIGRTTSALVYSASGSIVREKYFTYSADHNSVTVTDGSGASAIANTAYTDNDGHTVLSVAYPASDILEYTWNDFDLSGNLDYTEHDASFSGSPYAYTQTTFTHDGLNRTTSKVDRDNALTTYALDPMGNVTNRTMPRGLQWRATFNNAGKMLQEWNQAGGSGTRTNAYAYFSGGSPFAGLLQTKTDGRGVTCAYSYDDWLRVTNMASSGTLAEQNLTTTYQFEPRGLLTGITEQFASTNTGPATSISHSFDPYGQVSGESVNGGAFGYGSSQSWDAAGRRTILNIGSGSYGFNWRADGNLVAASDPTGSGGYTFDTAGLLTSRIIGTRVTSITSRDGEGRPLSIATTVNTLAQLTESLAWSGDGLLATHTLTRSDFTDTRAYSYANLSRRLTQEQLNLNGSKAWTNNFAYDNGTAAGPGALTSAGQGSALWNGVTDSFSRVGTETNNMISYAAYGHINGQATLNGWLDNQPISVTAIGTNAMQWRAAMELAAGTHQLKVAALHPSGQFTAWATNSFTNSIAYQTTGDTFDNAGNITQRLWKNANGTTNKIQTLSWDARGRLHSVTERDASNSGYNWTAIYDGLNRRLSTTAILVTNGVAFSYQPKTINQYYDPLVEFLELGVAYNNNQTVWKLYGPDLNGKYGGENGTGGLDGFSPYLNLFTPVISDFRGNIIGAVTNGVVAWSPARPSGYGSVAGYRPLALGNGADISLSSAWRGRWVDITGYHQIGLRPYDSISGRWLTYDSVWNDRDPNYYSFAGGDPVNGFDSSGRAVIQAWQQTQQSLINSGGFWNNAGAYGISFGMTALNAFSVGSFGRNDNLVDRNLTGEISDGQLYAGMAINTGAAAAAVVTGGAVAPIAGRALVAAGSPALMYIGSGAAAGLSASAVDVAVQRAGDAAASIPYNGTVGSDLTYMGTSTLGGAAFGAVTYGAVRAGQGVVYQRTDASGNLGDYYGQAQNDVRYAARQGEHADANPNSQFNFQQVSGAASGDNLDFMEQFQITANGGARTQNPLTPLSNDIRSMSDARFSDFIFDTTVNNGIGGTMGGNAYISGPLGTKR